jgi:protein tyrosine phosphatase (PTP) superfamily phosphohydrolase (DUF442 family)
MSLETDKQQATSEEETPNGGPGADGNEESVPPMLSGKGFMRKGLVRWATMGGIRLVYRQWTRIAAHAFPEDSRRAALATKLGVPLPDRLNMSWVTPSLAVGGRILPADIPRLAARGVTRVVDTRSEYMDDKAALAATGIELLYLPAPDTFPLAIEQLREGADWINAQITAGQRVLVHCEHGVGRSVLLTSAALVAQGMNAHDALRLIQRRRWQASPNHRQMQRLQEFERAVHGSAARHNV